MPGSGAGVVSRVGALHGAIHRLIIVPRQPRAGRWMDGILQQHEKKSWSWQTEVGRDYWSHWIGRRTRRTFLSSRSPVGRYVQPELDHHDHLGRSLRSHHRHRPPTRSDPIFPVHDGGRGTFGGHLLRGGGFVSREPGSGRRGPNTHYPRRTVVCCRSFVKMGTLCYGAADAAGLETPRCPPPLSFLSFTRLNDRKSSSPRSRDSWHVKVGGKQVLVTFFERRRRYARRIYYLRLIS